MDPFVLQQLVPAPVDAVYALLSDPMGIPRLHPLVTRVDVLERTSARVSFSLHERVPLGPFTWPNTYHGEFHFQPDAPRRLRTRGLSFPAVTVEVDFHLEPHPTGMLLTERLSVRAPRLLRGFVTRTAIAAHRQQLASLAAHFASRPATT